MTQTNTAGAQNKNGAQDKPADKRFTSLSSALTARRRRTAPLTPGPQEAAQEAAEGDVTAQEALEQSQVAQETLREAQAPAIAANAPVAVAEASAAPLAAEEVTSVTVPSRPAVQEPAKHPAPSTKRYADMSFYAPSALLTRLADWAMETSRSQVNILLDSVEENYRDIPTEIATRREGTPNAGLFERSERSRSMEDGSTTNMRLPQASLDTIDRLWKDAKANSRSEYLRIALELHFAKSEPKSE